MKNYSLDEHLQRVDALVAEGDSRPVIGLTTNYQDIDATLRDRYYQQVVAAGGVPVLLPPIDDEGVLLTYINHIDGLILTGGGDCDPRWAGEEPSHLLGNVNEVRDMAELLLTRLAYNSQMPLLGICRGMQMMAIALGGHVSQDISLDPLCNSESGVIHSQKEARDITTHTVTLDTSSTLYDIYQREKLQVNSFHHQTTDTVPPLFRPIAWADDGVIEGMESNQRKPLLGIQWHPEWLAEDGRPIFAWLVGEAKVYKEAKRLHKTVVTIDSHCDTPMFFPQGADFTHRDERIKVDLFKMTDGRLDVATMAAYVPQPVGSQEWKDVMPIATDSPFDYANLIFDRTEALVATSTIPVSIARQAGDVIANKQRGRKSIMLAIENALAIGDDISKIDHFKKRGVVYITLCHNGDNQVCDSARCSTSTWHGLSSFGQKVVEKMNDSGIMIDLSHASEQSFFDVLDLSLRPVVCSHSNCKALCNHERNLSDEQLRRLAARDGVCQLTLYDGFVSHNPKEADILSFVQHVIHAVHIMGIEHVGIGSDFDGDGGVVGLNDASEMINFTRQLLKNHFSEEEIRLIWGGNWLRVMDNNNKINTL